MVRLATPKRALVHIFIMQCSFGLKSSCKGEKIHNSLAAQFDRPYFFQSEKVGFKMRLTLFNGTMFFGHYEVSVRARILTSVSFPLLGRHSERGGLLIFKISGCF